MNSIVHFLDKERLMQLNQLVVSKLKQRRDNELKHKAKVSDFLEISEVVSNLDQDNLAPSIVSLYSK
jgi:hypothetical protein